MTESNDKMTEERQLFGQLIESSRVIEGFTQKRLSETTKIPLKFIEEIEAGTLSSSFKPVYVKGFLRILAKSLNAEPADYLQAFAAAYPEDKKSGVSIEEVTELQKVTGQKGLISNQSRPPRRRAIWQGLVEKVANLKFAEPPLTEKKSEPKTQKESNVFVRWFPVFLGAAAVLAFTIFQDNGNKEESTVISATLDEPTVEVARKTEETVAPSSTTNPQKAVELTTTVDNKAEESIQVTKKFDEPLESKAEKTVTAESNLTVSVQDGVVVKVSKDGQPRETLSLSAGDEKSFDFSDELQLLILDASRVSLKYNGRDLGRLGAPGRVRRISFSNAPADGVASL